MPTSPDLIVVNAKPKELHPIEDFLSSAADFEHRAGGSFSDPQNLAIHVTALVGASLSFVIVLIALRWFLLMRRSFRHQLVMFLIISDTAKALWYFVFSVVIFAKGLVSTPSEFCQASGFLLQFSIEACDMAIFIIALHSILYIKHPTSRMGEGGLYPYRKWICFLWLGPPLLSASLAFVNESTAYVTAGTFCFLPKRPFWYRLALSWVPRYLIISMILGMYIWIYVYIHFKFRGFENFAMTDSSDRSRWDSRLASPPLNESQNLSKQAEGNSSVPTLLSAPEISSLPDSGAQKEASTDQQSDSQTLRPWDKMTFATTRRLSGATASQPSLDESSGMTSRFSSAWSGETQLPAVPWSVMDATMHSSHDTGQKSSASPAGTSGDTDELQSASPEQVGQRITVGDGLTDQLKQTRAAIRKQLRYLFIYPLVHIIMWSFPFASHALTYSHYYVMHPIFWLAVVQTAMLSLQAGVDGILFSWMERPWRRVDGNSKLSIPFLKRQSKALLERHCPEKNSPSRPTPIAMQTAPVKRNLNCNFSATNKVEEPGEANAKKSANKDEKFREADFIHSNTGADTNGNGSQHYRSYTSTSSKVVPCVNEHDC
ncbi:uncharacterized protein A1O9_10905 [Exophiala aquamarina CBS 119918]|uniref:G-protein coupled receptors family 1 profile domain-containing protein n=1 Tax=Exophiala aquamarina CBS 119918 TaxID=1182545 RepID=A0A072NZZ4_9EURO|nr:uncharacterized protein A1O9_10905 [Exophiala aquamarina CBS 119918]KEF52997.1 hypothetical protein A1O9_10905 [Exophiala aquamarina CBS 119918]